jgi:putative transposase
MNPPRSPRKLIHHYDGEGHARELTFSCFQRQPLFSHPTAFDWFFRALTKARNKHPIHVWACVVMPEHVHLLVWPTDHKFPISDLLESLKSSVSKRARNYYLKHGLASQTEEFHFWQAGPGYDRNLDNPESIWAGIDYFHANPVRRGLCDRPIDWPWSSAGLFAGIADGPFSIDRESLPDDPR